MVEALYYTKFGKNIVKCHLCPHECTVHDGKSGICRVRKNIGGQLFSETYGKLVALHVDPIEKKPLYNFFPGKQVLSVGTMGCNFFCSFCQNHSISQCNPDSTHPSQSYTPKEIARYANSFNNNIGIAYTYNEPTIFYEYVLQTSKLVKEAGQKNIMISNGFISEGPLKELLPFIDAFNIDLKSFSNEFYTTHAKGKLAPVLKTLEVIAHAGKHLEITNLVITNVNDNEQEFKSMVKWIVTNLGKKTPLHISRYFPVYKLLNPSTPISTLESFYEIASNYLSYVYLGNTPDSHMSDSYCPQCKNLLVERKRYTTKMVGIDTNTNCSSCNAQTGFIIN